MAIVRGGSGAPALVLVALLVAGCGSSAATPPPATGTPSTAPATPAAASTPTIVPPTGAATATGSGGFGVRYLDLADGATVTPETVNGHPVVRVRVEVTGGVAIEAGLSVDGQPANDAEGRQVVALNPAGAVPFDAELAWSPISGGGDYTLTVAAVTIDKDIAQATIRVTVAGIAHATPSPALSRERALAQATALFEKQYGVHIPAPSLQRFDFPSNPTRSRWIAAAYYRGIRYYVSIFDDTHVEWATGPYASQVAPSTSRAYTWCRPTGTYRILVVFVDYGNTGATRASVLAAVPPVVSWTNGLYASFAASQGLAAPLLTVTADSAYVPSPPAKGELLTAEQIRTLTGRDPGAYDLRMQIDLDANASFAAKHFPGVLNDEGGFALNGCGVGSLGIINIWSTTPRAAEVEGGLIMDFNHELSHMFGMMDDWPYVQGIPGPSGLTTVDWIPYVMLGWTDTDGDGVPEIIDPTPYGTSGPRP